MRPFGPSPLLVLVLLSAVARPVRGHELRPAFIDLDEDADGVTVTATWPAVEAAPERLAVQLPAPCMVVAEQAPAPLAVARIVMRTRWRCAPLRLRGQALNIQGLTVGVAEAVVHARLLAGLPLTLVADRDHPVVVFGGPEAPARPAASFVVLGVRHIVEGLDHLLFILGLLMIVLRHSDFPRRGLRAVPWRRLLGTVTAFTVAHSITLGASALGLLTLPPRGVEATIALSILAVALELARPPTTTPSLTVRRPAVLAFGFGLLHGFGFAAALAEVGLPPAARVGALVRFNVGVELGQLAFVAVASVALSLGRRLTARSLATLERVAVYGIGTLSSYWFWSRALTLFRLGS